MNNQLQNILTNKSTGNLTIGEVDLPYLDLIKVDESAYRFGYCERGWVFFYEENISLIHWEDSNFISMIKILEVDPNKLVGELHKSIKELGGKPDDIHLFFPIKGLTEYAFQMGGSGYWKNLCMDFLTFIEYYDFDTKFMEEYLGKYKLAQPLKHKIQKFLARSKWRNK